MIGRLPFTKLKGSSKLAFPNNFPLSLFQLPMDLGTLHQINARNTYACENFDNTVH